MSRLLISAHNNPDYWTDVKYYIRNDLHHAWEIQDNEYLTWAGEFAQHSARAKFMLNNLMQDMHFSTARDIERHLEYCEKYHLETHDALLGHATAFGLDFVKHVAGRLSQEKIKQCSNITIYYTMQNNNVEALEHFDRVLDLDLRTIYERFYFHNMIEAAQNLQTYIVRKSLLHATKHAANPTTAKKI